MSDDRMDFHKKLWEALQQTEGLDNVQAAPQVMARFLKEKVDCPELFIQWMVDHFAGRFIEEYSLPHLNKCHELLVKHGHTEEEPFRFNDWDNSAFFIPSDNCKVMGFTSQNYNLLYVWEQGWRTQLHIRRYYDVYNPDEDEWIKKDDDEFKALAAKEGLVAAIKYAERLKDQWADDYKDNHYPDRLSLAKFKEMIKFYPDSRTYPDPFRPAVYWDCRDKGYVLSYDKFEIPNREEWGFSKCDRVMSRQWNLAWYAIELDINTTHTCLTEDYEDAQDNAE